MDLNKDLMKIFENHFDDIAEEIQEMFEKHLDDQPYSLVCASCGEDLEKSVKIDGDHDLTIEVQPCDCKKE